MTSQNKSLLRVITCGSVDDGKSTLLGRLLYEAGGIFQDQLATIEKDSKKYGTQGDQIDFALLLDGLSSEREQGITIDVAYRYFSTKQRKYILADSPGHEQYTRNMVTGASTADVAIVLVDATKGLLEQTKRHSYLVHLMGVHKIILAINKMDLVHYDQTIFQAISNDYRSLAAKVGVQNVVTIPVSALKGDNITKPSPLTPWYHGQTLLTTLDELPTDTNGLSKLPFRFSVQWVNRPSSEFRGYTGTIASGEIQVGDFVQIHPSQFKTQIKEIFLGSNSISSAEAGLAVTLTTTDERDISRGHLLTKSNEQSCQVGDQIEAHLVWMDENPLIPGRTFWMKIGSQTCLASVTRIKHQININNFDKIPATKLVLNSVSICNLSLNQKIGFDPYTENRMTGSFILIDRVTHQTSGAGMIHFALRRSENIPHQKFDINKTLRAELNHHKPCVIWMTGLSGSGKSTIANELEKDLYQHGYRTYILDGDNIRHGLSRDLGYTEVDRVENNRRTAEIAKLMTDAGLIVIVTLVSPYAKDRNEARQKFDTREFIEVFVDTPLNICEQRDPKGLYKKARSGQLKNFTGFDSPYEQPSQPEVHIKTEQTSPANAKELIKKKLKELGIIPE